MHHQDKYNLKWHSYSDHLREALKEMMTSNVFADVTLVTDDKQKIRAHRNILSACSPVFKNILQLDSNTANPIVYLRGIQHSEMESIMQFIYLGEAMFYKARMHDFLMVSKNLEIKSLSTGIEMNDQTESNEDDSEHENSFVEDDVYNDPAQTLKEDFSTSENQADIPNKPITENNAKSNRVSISRVDGVKYDCNQCSKQFTTLSNLKTHIQAKHEGVKYACNQCDYQATQQAHLTTHSQAKHEGVRYACNQCDYQARRLENLTTHILYSV